jgi:DNA gyrase subunit B
MYIGDISEGPHHLFNEILDNSVDEFLSGFGTRIEIDVAEDGGWIKVKDYGRGIPVDKTEYGIPGVTLVFTEINTGGKFKPGKNYEVSGGLHGVGLSAVCALSIKTNVEIRRDKKIWRESYSRGIVEVPLKSYGKAEDTGTSIYMEADPEIFTVSNFDITMIESRIQDLSFLLPGCEFILKVENSPARLFKTNGLGELLDQKMRDYVATRKQADRLCNPFLITGKASSEVELALCFTNATALHTFSFVNCITTHDGGTHEVAIKKTVLNCLKGWVGSDKFTFENEDLQDGLWIAVHLKTKDTAFSSQTKEKFVGKSAGQDIPEALNLRFQQWITANDDLMKKVFTLAQQRCMARKQSSKLQKLEAQIKINDSKLKRGSVEGGIMDCRTTKVEESEVFIVEGRSAAGSARQAKDHHFQAVLPLRGKIINAYRSNLTTLLANEEIKDILNTLGCGYGKSCDPSMLRYGKIILLMDADPDGGHITSLMLGFFFKYLRPIIEQGRVYVVDGPLFAASKNREKAYFYTLDEAKEKLGKDFDKWILTRMKGWGECNPDVLKIIALGEDTRKLYQIQLTDETPVRIEEMMSEDSQFRKLLLTS